MSAYVDNVEERMRRENPEAWMLMKEIEGHFRRHGIDISDAIFWDSDMTEEEEKMAILEYELKKGRSLEEATIEVERCYESIKEFFRQWDMAEKIREQANKQQIKKVRG